MLGPLVPAEEVQCLHEAGCFWRARGHAEVSGGHFGTGTVDDETVKMSSVINKYSININHIFYELGYLSVSAVNPDRAVHLSS